jgi:phage/plasmid-like protein (TIGR03299 family)
MTDRTRTYWGSTHATVAHCRTSDELCAAAFPDPVEKVQGYHFHNGLALPATGKFFTRNATTGEVYGAVGAKFRATQQADAFRVLDPMLGEHGGTMAGAGMLPGGVAWALLDLPGQHVVERLDGSGDAHARQFLVLNPNNGRQNTRGFALDTRLSCLNQVPSFVVRGGKGFVFSIRHSGDVTAKLEEAARIMERSAVFFAEVAELEQQLAKERMARSEMREFAERLLLDTEASIEAAKQTLGKRSAKWLEEDVEELEALFTNGQGNRGESRYDALNAVTEWVDHKRRAGNEATRNVMRLSSAWQGSGAEIKARAVKLLAR